MSHHEITINEDLWFVAFSQERGKVHFGFAAAPAIVTSGQHELLTFVTEGEMSAKIDQLKGVTGWYEAHKPISVETDIAGNVT